MGRLNFTGYNFDDLAAQLRAIVKAQDAWKDVDVTSGTGNFLIELFSYVAEMLMYYLERRAQESYIDTAQLRSSVARMVALINYKPKRPVASMGNLLFTLVGGAYGQNIYIPKGTVCSNADGTKFTVLYSYTINSSITSLKVQAIQGEFKNVLLTADGTANYAAIIDSVKVDNSDVSTMTEADGTIRVIRPATITVKVNNEQWLLVDNFVLSDSNSKVFTHETQLDGTVKVIFGDGKFGKIPELGDSISIDYLETEGSVGNIYSSGQITTIDSVIYDGTIPTALDVTSLLTVTNDAYFSGGDDEEDIEEIRNEAPLVFKTGQRAVTREDFIAIMENMPSVKTAYVWGERDELPDFWQTSTYYAAGVTRTDVTDNSVWECQVANTSGSGSFADERSTYPSYWDAVPRYADITMFNKIKLVCLLSDWVEPDNDFKLIIKSLLINKEQLTVWLEFVDADIIDTIIDLQVKVLGSYQSSTIVSDINTALDTAFALGTVKLGSSVRYSDIVHLMENVVGVDYVYLSFKHRELMGMGDTANPQIFSTTQHLLPMKADSVQIYIDSTLVAQDNGSGYIVAVSASGVTGTVDYNAGLVAISVGTPSAPLATSEAVYCYYQQDQQGDIICDKTEIPKLITKNITVL